MKIFVIRISQDEAKYLRDNNMASSVIMSSKTHKSKKKRYFAVNSPRAERLLNEFWNSKSITCIGG